MFGQRNIIVIWVAARQLTILGGKIEVPEKIVIPPNVVGNLEVYDRDALYALIKEWAVKRPVVGAEIVWIFGHDVYFEKIIPLAERAEADSEVVRFLDLLPFEETESRVFNTPTDIRAVAINKDFFDSLKRGFALQGYLTKMEVVASALGKVGEVNEVNKDVYEYVMKNLDGLQKSRVVGEEVENITLAAPTTAKPKSQLPLLIGVFAVLLGIMVFMLLRMNK